MILILVALSGGGSLTAPAAASYERMSKAYGSPIPVTSATRSAAAQDNLRVHWLRRDAGYNFALPSDQSMHVLGYAVDFGAAAYTWLDAYANDYGFIQTNPAERWHREYEILRDRHLVDTLIALPKHLKITTSTKKVRHMDTFVETLYEAYLGRKPTVYNKIEWAKNFEGLTYEQAEDLFKTSTAEPGTVVAAFALFGVEGPNIAQIAEWTGGKNIAAVWYGIGNSPAALAKK